LIELHPTGQNLTGEERKTPTGHRLPELEALKVPSSHYRIKESARIDNKMNPLFQIYIEI